MNERVIRWVTASASWLERLLALGILVGIIVFAVAGTTALTSMDWGNPDAFYEMMYRVLMLIIGVELARTLLTHDLEAILELLAFVVARKILKPEVAALDIFLSVTAFVGLLVARKYLLRLSFKSREESPAPPGGRPASPANQGP